MKSQTERKPEQKWCFYPLVIEVERRTKFLKGKYKPYYF